MKIINKNSGFTVLEGMVAMAIMSFGLLSLGKFQTTMVSNSDIAKQKTEATRLAEEKLEKLRAFESIAASTGKFAYEDIVSSSDQVLGKNTTYTRRVTVQTQSTSTAKYKPVSVTVSWTDRKGDIQTVTLSTVFASSEPKSAGALAVSTGNSLVKRPKNRDLNVPIPSIDLGNGKSAFTPPGASTFYYVFDNLTGVVTAKCSGLIRGVTAPVTGASCDNFTGYIVSGYIKFSTGNRPIADNPLSSTVPLSVATSRLLAVNGVALANRPDECTNDSSQSSQIYDNTVTYTCLVQPYEHDADPVTPPIWSGYITMILAPPKSIGLDSSQYRLCRYSNDYNRNGITDNNEHPSPYVNVTKSLENQNFLFVRGDKDCPADNAAISSSAVNYNTIQVQP